MVSFRFLNPRLVDTYPMYMDSVCYRGIGDEPDVLCHDIPPNRMRFLGYWYITPERHFYEWVGFLVVGMILVVLLVPKMASNPRSLATTSTNINTLTPRLWMIVSTLLFYPYVAYTKLSWPGSYYPGRWLMFVGMPVGTLWILSALFCGSGIVLGRNGNGNKNKALFCGSGIVLGRNGNDSDSHYLRHTIRYWILETWLSFLPLIVDWIPGLFDSAIFSVKQYANGTPRSSGHDGDNANISYFCHGAYLFLVPVYYFWIGELSPRQTWTRNPATSRRLWLWRLAMDGILRQSVGTAICVIYHMGIVTPAAIVVGQNVNGLLVPDDDGVPNFRMDLVAEWFYHGCAIRWFLGAAKIAWETTRRVWANLDGDGDRYRQ